MRRKALALACLIGTLAPASQAAAAPGDLFVTESLSGSVLEFSDGGDLSAAPRFATGLTQPVGICRGPEGHIYVAEYSGEITIIDDGGDMSAEAPFAFGAPGIIALWCDDERILTSIFYGGLEPPQSWVFNVAAGGEVAQIPLDDLIVNQNLTLTTSIVVDDLGSIFALGTDVFDVTAGGDLTTEAPFAFGVGLISSELHDGMLLGGAFQAPGVWDFTAGGDLSAGTAWATLPDGGVNGVEAIVDGGELGVFAMSNNAIYEITGGGDVSGNAAFASGLNAGLVGEEAIAGVEGMLHHVCSTDDDCADADLCNGDELCINNECVDPAGPADCDDEDVCTDDSCSAEGGCANDPIDNCCHDDFDCDIDEVCDAGTNECVATDPTAGGEESSTDGGAGEETGIDPTVAGTEGPTSMTSPSTTAPGGGTETGSDTDDPGAIEEGGGCACTTNQSTPNSPVFALLVAAGFFLRRRRR